MFEHLNTALDSLTDNTGSADDRWNDIPSILGVTVNIFVIVAFGVSFITFAYSLVQFITSTGDPKKLEKPKSALTWSLAGMLLSAVVFTLRKVLLGLLGVDEATFY